MRNIFDQYTQPENRLTHALVCCLSEDRRLLRRFIRWALGQTGPKASMLEIVEQRLPGEEEFDENETSRRGLPDACIHDGDTWCLLIESKVASPLSQDQLNRHYRTAQRRGYSNITLLVLDVEVPKRKLPAWAVARKWTEVYQWLVEASNNSEWARRTAEYFEVAESKFTEDGYLKDGTLTVFSGIPFDEGVPYSYPEAKRLIKLAMEELRQRKDLVKQIGMEPKGDGRGAITGKAGNAVWDFLRLKGTPSEEPFNKYPHLTLSIKRDLVNSAIIIPNSMDSTMRRNLLDLGLDGFSDLFSQINQNLVKTLRKENGAAPWIEVAQRHFASRRSKAARFDARLEYDLRTAFKPKQNTQATKFQPEWLKATYDAFSHKRSNLQVAVGAIFPYSHCKVTKSKEVLDYVAGTWIACKPLLDVMMKGNAPQAQRYHRK